MGVIVRGTLLDAELAAKRERHRSILAGEQLSMNVERSIVMKSALALATSTSSACSVASTNCLRSSLSRQPGSSDDRFADRCRGVVRDVQLRRDGHRPVDHVHETHHLVEQRRDDATVRASGRSFEGLAERDTHARHVVLAPELRCETHRIGTAGDDRVREDLAFTDLLERRDGDADLIE